jgi:hypothetical protein
MFAMTKPSGFSSRMTVKLAAASGSSIAMPTEPEAIGRPATRAARARVRFTPSAVSLPPVMPLM